REQGAQGGARVEIALAVRHVGVGQQHLRGLQAVAAEGGLVGLREPHLADGGGGLQLVHGVRAFLPAEALHALGDRAARDQDDLLAHLAERGDLLGEARDGGGIHAAPFIGDERRPHLDDERGRLLNHFFFSSLATAFIAASQPFPLMADTLNQGLVQRNARRALAMRWSASLTASILLKISQRGFFSRPPPCFLTSAAITRMSCTRLLSDRSTTCNSRLVRARWRRNWWPRPAPSDAPSLGVVRVGEMSFVIADIPG